MKLSILVTHYKTPSLLENCLNSLLGHVKGIEYEIFVVDSAAELPTRLLMEETFNLSFIHYIPFKENVGYGRSVNAGLEHAKGEFLFIINADILVQGKNAVLLLMEYLEKNPKVGLVGPKLVNIDGSLQQSYFREPSLGAILARRTAWSKTRWGKRSLDYYEFRHYTEQSEKKGIPYSGKRVLDVDWLMGSCYMTRRAAFLKVGPFDERYWMYFEDVDWARRFREAGYRVVYYPAATFTHYHIRSSKGERGIFDFFSNPYTRVHVKSWLQYVWKWNASFAKQS